ncbi:Leucine-rich repeat-containing protein 23, partial [Globomyces sp. JEL0801]
MDDDNENEVEKGLIDTLEPVAAAEEEEAIPVSADMLPLTPELIASSLSLVARTAQGLSHAFTRLEIHEKEITNLNALETYPHLRYVDCSDNNLVNIEGLNNLKYLLALNLQNNYISSIPSGLDRREFLQHVNLAKNNFKDWTVNYWPMCSFLNLNENKLTESVTFDGYPELLHLELRANKFKATPEKLVAPKLQRLYL